MEFDTITEVPIFHSCREFPKPGDMARIAALNNSRFTRPSIVVGHGKPGAQTPAVGQLSNFTVGKHNGVETLFADFNLYKTTAEHSLQSYPNRSIELMRSGEIGAVALVSNDVPKCDRLGTMFQFANETEKFYYSVLDTPMQDNIDESKPLTLGDVKQLLEAWDVTAWVRGEMAKQAMNDVQAAPEAPAPEESPEVAPEAPVEGEEPAPEAEASEAPAEAPADEAPEAPADEAPEEDEADEIKKAYAELKLKYTLATREKVLMSLQGEGISLDINEELDPSLSDEQFSSQVARIKKNYSRLPASKFSAATRKPVDSEGEWNRVRDYATANGLTYSQAKAKLQGAK